MNNYNYPYYGNNYGYSVQPGFYTQQQQVQPQQYYQQPQQRYSPITFVNGLVGVKSHIVNPNEKIYLLDSDNPVLYVKSADNEGRYSIEAFELNKIELDKVGVEKKLTQNKEQITKDDFKALEQRFTDMIGKLSSDIKSVAKTLKNKVVEGDM